VIARAEEVERGWVEFACLAYGVLVVASPACFVRCRCGRRAKRTLNGTVLKGRDIERLQKAVRKSLQATGSVSPNGDSQPPKRPRRLRSNPNGSEAV
jgi:hypothetical protein